MYVTKFGIKAPIMAQINIIPDEYINEGLLP
jgi:hypothetical protein